MSPVIILEIKRYYEFVVMLVQYHIFGVYNRLDRGGGGSAYFPYYMSRPYSFFTCPVVYVYNKYILKNPELS